ncbi:flagellar FlbD family protein [Bacillaceae bacterium W0354]
MINVTRLNNQQFVINAIFIEKIEALPDTTITLANGKKYFVKESVEEVIKEVNDYYKQIGLIDLSKKVVVDDE